MRISTRGSVDIYLGNALRMLRSEFEHLKFVGRGEAVALAEELLDLLSHKAKYCSFSVNYTESFNKKGQICDEIHVMVSHKKPLSSSTPHYGKFAAATSHYYEDGNW